MCSNIDIIARPEPFTEFEFQPFVCLCVCSASSGPFPGFVTVTLTNAAFTGNPSATPGSWDTCTSSNSPLTLRTWIQTSGVQVRMNPCSC